MSGFTGGRRAPNVSQYLADLNTIPGPQDLSGQQNDFGGLGDDLDFLTNTEFFDFDNFNNVDCVYYRNITAGSWGDCE